MSSAADWTILPDDLWLEQTARPLLGSTDPSSPQLPEALTKIATRHLEVRNGSKLHAYEVEYLAQYIHHRLPQLDPSAVSRAGADEPTHTGTMQGLLDYWSCVVDRGGNTQASASDAYTPPPFHDTAALGQFLRENGALDMTDDDDDDATSQTADSEAMRQLESDTVATTASGNSAPPACKRFGCGYCEKDFSKRFELNRHWTGQARSCTERFIGSSPCSGPQCSRCGKKTSEPGTGPGTDSIADHDEDFGTGVRTDHLQKGWRRGYPKLSDQEEESEFYEPSEPGYPFDRPTLFLGRYRDSESAEWKFKHVQFRHNPNARKPARGLGSAEMMDAYA